MRGPLPKKIAAILLAVVCTFGLIFFVVHQWVVPSVLVGKLEALTGSKVEIGSWWINGSSAGVTGLRVMENGESGARALAVASKVTTDLTLASVLRGQFMPKRIDVVDPELTIHLDKDGKLLTTIGSSTKTGTGPPTLPIVTMASGKVTFQQEGRPDMVIEKVNGRVEPDSKGILLSARTSDPRWGSLQALGHFSGDFETGRVDLKSIGTVPVDPEKCRSIPFVPRQVWDNVLPTGDVGLNASVERGTFGGKSIRVGATIRLIGTSLDSPSLSIKGTGANGTVTILDGLVKFDKVGGQSLGGKVVTDGVLDFDQNPPKADINIALADVDIAAAPPSWQLGEIAVTGRLTGEVRLLGEFKSTGLDLSGTSGNGTVVNGTIDQIPFKSIKLAVKAEGTDLQYETPDDAGGGKQTRFGPILRPYVAAMSWFSTLSFQVPPGVKPDQPGPPAIIKPRTITTDLEFEDVDIAQIIGKAQGFLGYPFPIPIAGKFSLKAKASIPLGKMKDVKSYGFHGDLTLTGASIYAVDIGKVSARLDLTDGLLELKDFRGLLADHPTGSKDNPPKTPSIEVPKEGPLPVGGFRGKIVAQLSPLGALKANFEGNDLPLGELAAPALPKPTPLSGSTTVNVEADVDLSKAKDPQTWIVTGTAKSRAIRYQAATLNGVDAEFDVKAGQFSLSKLTAILDGKPLKGQAHAALNAPHEFGAEIDVDDWQVASIIKWIPNAPPTLPISGTVSTEAKASGTIIPLNLTTDGTGSFNGFQAGQISLGQVPFNWKTKGDDILIRLDDSKSRFGGLTLDAKVPLKGEGPIQGDLVLKDVDTSKLSELMPGQNIDATGKVSGEGKFSIPKGSPHLDADVAVSSTELTIQGLPAEKVQVKLNTKGGNLQYEMKAQSLGGTVKLNGLIPILGETETKLNVPNGKLRVLNFNIEPVWAALGQTGPLSEIGGRGGIEANIHASITDDPPFLARGIAEFRDLKWGLRRPVDLGGLRGIVALSPESWRLDPLTGNILGGQISGSASGTFPKDGASDRVFEVRVDRMAFSRMMKLASPGLPTVSGYATIRLAGASDGALRVNGQIDSALATVDGYRVTEIRIPATFISDPSGTAGIMHLRKWSARLAGGTMRGDSSFRIGESEAFQTEVKLSSIEIETIARTMSDARRPASGQVSGSVFISGTRPGRPKTYRGRFDLELSDASLVALPIFREIDKFLGSARGGLFEEGDLSGTISNGNLNVESMTLAGRIAQVHATGTIGFDNQLNLEVLVNTNQIIPQTGQALVALIPGLNNLTRNTGRASGRVSDFLSNKLLKLRVTGTLKSPNVAVDPGMGVADTAVSFFGGILKLPLGFLN